jgi:hypothetical protein
MDEVKLSRPDGFFPMLTGWLFLGACAVFMLLAVAEAPSPSAIALATSDGSLGAEYTAEVASSYAWQFWYQVAAGACFSLFLVFWSVGYIVRALSFLTGVGTRTSGEGREVIAPAANPKSEAGDHERSEA